MEWNDGYKRGFLPYGLSAFLIGLVGGFSTVLGPAFAADMGLAYSSTTWTALAQAVSTAACAPILGKLGDVVGGRRTLLLGLGVFTAGNALSAAAGSLWAMMGARFVVGLGSAAMAPVILAYIVTAFPRDKVAAGFSLYMLISSASVIAGPTLGSLMLSAWGWRAMVWACTGISAVTLGVCIALGGEREEWGGMPREFDWAGCALVVLFFSLALCVPSFGQNFGWGSREFRLVLVFALVSLGGLIWAECRGKNPILSGRFMKRRAFVLSVVALFLTQGLMQANMTNTIVFVSYTRPGNAALSGSAISVMYLGMSLGAALLGPLGDRLEPRRVLTGSLLLTGGGCALQLLFSDETPLALLMASLGVLGFGLGGNGTIFMKVVLSGIPAEKAGAGTGTYGLFRDLAAPFGVAVFVPFFTNRISGAMAGGAGAAEAAVTAMGLLAAAELLCVAGGLAVVQGLPNIRKGGKKA